MKNIFLLPAFFFFTSLTASAQKNKIPVSSSNDEIQIKNPGFELKNDSIATLPKYWNYTKSDGFVITLDSIIKSSGHHSLQISNLKNTGQGVKLLFNQSIPIQFVNARQLLISAFIKTDNIKGRAGLTIHARDKNDKLIGVGSTQYIKLDSTTDWKKYEVPIIIDKDVKKLVLNGLLIGTGTVWFDDFTMTDISLSNTTPAFKEVSKFVDQFIDTVQFHSLYSDSINWVSLRKDIKDISKGLKTIEESYPLLNYILGKLKAVGDNHSYILPKHINENRLASNIIESSPEGRYLENNIGYIKIPGFNSGNEILETNFAEKIQGLIKYIDSENKITGWIVDLREDRGGNMYPMIAGLGPILGEDTLGYFFSGSKKTAWFYSKKGSGEGSDIATKITNPYYIKNADAKIAVLIGSRTASSGEATAISFIGRSNTKLFGTPSGGYTTGNAGFTLKDGSLLLLASSVEADRNMKKYPERIYPDITVESSKNKEEDACVEAAKKWILNK
jgi:hypothetical protein